MMFSFLSSDYRVPVTDRAAYHFYHSLGVVSAIKKKAPVVVPPPPPPVVLDKDGDGINDDKDACPDVAGLAILDGCPDKDSDGIADKNDRCRMWPDLPNTAVAPFLIRMATALMMNRINASTKGFARYQGCPIPDTDNDGVNDEDKCPNRPGPASNMGCPKFQKL